MTTSLRAGEPSRPQTLCSGRAHLNRLTAKFRALALALRRDAAEKRLLKLREKLAIPSAGVSLAYPKIVSSSLFEEGRLNYGTCHIILSGLRQRKISSMWGSWTYLCQTSPRRRLFCFAQSPRHSRPKSPQASFEQGFGGHTPLKIPFPILRPANPSKSLRRRTQEFLKPKHFAPASSHSHGT